MATTGFASTGEVVNAVYQGTTPTTTFGGLQPLQVALANYMAEANLFGRSYDNNPWGINQAFLDEMKTFTDPGTLTPLTFDERTGIAKEPDIDRTITAGIGFISQGDDIYLLRRALDCGPDENRTELVFLGNRFDLAEGSFAFYGSIIMGTVAGGAGGSDGGGSPYYNGGPCDPTNTTTSGTCPVPNNPGGPNAFDSGGGFSTGPGDSGFGDVGTSENWG